MAGCVTVAKEQRPWASRGSHSLGKPAWPVQGSELAGVALKQWGRALWAERIFNSHVVWPPLEQHQLRNEND